MAAKLTVWGLGEDMPTLAIDFDETLTAIPVPISCLIRECRIIGWRVILVTRRYDTEANKQAITDFLAGNEISMDADRW